MGMLTRKYLLDKYSTGHICPSPVAIHFDSSGITSPYLCEAYANELKIDHHYHVIDAPSDRCYKYHVSEDGALRITEKLTKEETDWIFIEHTLSTALKKAKEDTDKVRFIIYG